MKLPKPEGRPFPSGRGNVKERNKLEEGRWKVLWTRVRFPSGPLNDYVTNATIHIMFYKIMWAASRIDFCSAEGDLVNEEKG